MTVDAVGGVWQYASELCSALASRGWNTMLACLGPPPSASQRGALAADAKLIETGLELDWMAPDSASVDSAGATIAALAEAEHADLVHLTQPALAAFTSFTMPIVAAAHSCVATWWDAVYGGKAPADFAWQTDRVRRGLARADAVVTPSRAFARDLERIYVLSSAPDVVPNGRTPFDLTPHQPEHFAFTAGRLWDPGKNIAGLDRVASRLQMPFRAAGALVGPHGQQIELRHIEPLGALDDRALAETLSKAPIFVSAAHYEPFGLAVLEAALAGCPLVLSDIASFRELWDGAAHFVSPSDELRFVEVIAALFANPETRCRWGALARRRAARFTPARMTDAMISIYTRVLGSHRSSGRGAAA